MLLRDTLRAVGFSYAKRERNHCEQLSAFPSSMRELVTPHVMHLMPRSFVNIYFFLEVFRYRRIKMLSHQKRSQKNDLILTVFLLFTSYYSTKMTPLFDSYVCRPLFRLSTIARKSQQSASWRAFYGIASCLNAAVVLVSACVRA